MQVTIHYHDTTSTQVCQITVTCEPQAAELLLWAAASPSFSDIDLGRWAWDWRDHCEIGNVLGNCLIRYRDHERKERREREGCCGARMRENGDCMGLPGKCAVWLIDHPEYLEEEREWKY